MKGCIPVQIDSSQGYVNGECTGKKKTFALVYREMALMLEMSHRHIQSEYFDSRTEETASDLGNLQ